MKRHGKLFSEIISLPNLFVAHRNAQRGKRHYAEVQEINEDEFGYLIQLQWMLGAKTFRTSPYATKQVHEPKERTIYILPYYPDRIVHHAVMNVLQPIWDRIFIYDVYSAIPGRGIHKAMERLDGFLEDEANTRYCLQFDVRKFYPSVNHDILMDLIRRKIKCPDTLWLLEDIVRSPDGDTNIPIGNYLSQYFANIYLNRFDHWLKEEWGIKYYIRYGDDAVILHGSKTFLRDLLDEIRTYLADRLHLELNPKTRVYPVEEGIDFLGYKTFREFRLLRTRSAKKFKAKMRAIGEYGDGMPARHVVSSIMSYVGWIQHADCYNLLREHVLDDLDVRQVLEHACDQLEIGNPLAKKYPEAFDGGIDGQATAN